jgi:hypothetical protein
MFACDHVFSTVWLGYFSVQWWVYTVHDGKQTPHSAAQTELIEMSKGLPQMTDEQRATAAMKLWDQEKQFASLLLASGWVLKVGSYFPNAQPLS